ncbi:MAG: nitroreductase family protein [Rikenellaceae bacterium]
MKRIFILFSLAFALVSTVSAASKDAEKAVLDNIMTRASVRAYTSQKVEKEKIDILLKAGMAAPTGSNKQPWEFVVITDEAVLAQFPTIAGGMKIAAKAPLVIVVVGNSVTSPSWMLDCSAASQNILLAAHAMGLGAVWTGAYSEKGNARMTKLSKLLELPEGVKPLNAIIIGYPEKAGEPKDKFKAEKVHYNKY